MAQAPRDPDGSADGSITWAGHSMPVLRSIGARLAEEGTLRGLRIGISLVLEPKTANLVLTLRDAGADVTVHCSGSSTDAATATSLRNAGVSVFAEARATPDRDLELAREFLSTGLDILVDDGAAVTRLAHGEFPELVASMIGATEETTSGVRPLRAMHRDGALQLPVIAVNDARTKYLFDNIYGTGQSCVMAMLDVTNLQLAGRRVLVIGYGWVGQGVARHAAAMGARVIVAELDPVKALRAFYDGHRVLSVHDAAPESEVVFASTGIAGVLTPKHAAQLPDGAIVCTAGGGSFELPMEYFRSLGTERAVRDGVTEYTQPNERRILVLSDGECINCADGEGNPIEVMDLSLALQALAVEHLAAHGKTLVPGVHPLGADAETYVAAARLAHEGATVEPMTDALAAAMKEW